MSEIPVPTNPARPVDKAQFWRDTLADFAASGLSVRAFCRSRGLHEKRFYTWRRQLGLSPVIPAADVPTQPFVPVRLVSEPMAELVLSGGLTLRVPVTTDPVPVARLVAALRDRSC
jgi:hypothetical protein